MNIYVSNLDFSVTEDALKQAFSSYGTVTSAKIISDKMTGKSRGFGFVEMENNEAAQKAIDGLNDTSMDGRSIKVTEARPKEDKPRQGGGFGERNFNNSQSYNKNRY
jgi:RNA recognition motif-containing protein